MARDADSSDDDIEIVPKSVDNYWLEHGDETPVSFASLPYFKTGEQNLPNRLVYVRGTQDNGMRLYMKAVAWKLEFSKDIKPVFHLKTEKYWIELKKPRKSFETTIRSIMSTAMFLNYALLNPGDPEKVAWNHVKDVYKSWDVAPRRDDLTSHLLVIRHLIESNECLASSCALQNIHTRLPRKRLALAREDAQQRGELHQYKYEEEHLDVEKELDTYGDDLDLGEAGNLMETVCCICDDGGDMICCDGPCMRSFHFKGASDSCTTLGLSKIDADRMDKFFCPNCKFKIHQCYACGELGCSDASGAACEVFLCGADMCGHFYHPSCVAKLVLKDKDTSEQVAMADSVKEGKGFVCPMHNCWKCGKTEVKEARNLQFGICRRCPRVWHRQCLPLSLLHADPKRCWYGLLPNKILVYCKRHTVIPELATPARNHVKFPEASLPAVHKRMVKQKAEEEGKKSKPSKLGSLKKKAATNLKSPGGHVAAKLLGKKRKPFSPLKQMKPEGHEPTKSKLNQGGVAPSSSLAKARDRLPAVNLVKERTNVGFSVKQELSENEQKCNSPSEGRSNLDAKLARTSVVVAKSPTPGKCAPHPLPQRNKGLVYKASPVDKETKSMVDDIIERAKSSVTIESVLMKHDFLEGSTQCSENRDRIYSLVKLESTIKGMSKAVETLENGGSIEDAKLQCSPDYISYIKSCMEDMKFYLAPLLHEARYTPYGQHCTKPEKVKVIVDRLHWYLEEGDMIVDFACGSSDFFLLMKKKLEESGKACEYRSFDLIQTSNDFNFSKQDCFEVKPSELPNGDRLIIRLNPPFGHRVNQFMDHALIFRPKLIVLTVPKAVQSLDQKKHDMYDLVWEDSNLPGSVDVDDNDWNNEPRLVYFWSRPDWTLEYKQIALYQGHISPLSSSHFAGSPRKASSPQPPSNSDFDMEKNRNDEATVELWGGEEKGDLGKRKYDRSQGELGIVNESIGGGDTIGDLDKRMSGTLQVEHMIMNEPTGGQVTVSNLDTSNVSKLDQIMRRRELLECDGPTLATQVNDNSLKSHNVKTTTKYSNNDGFVPLKRHTNMKRKGVDSSIEEASGSQFNQYSSQEAPEKARNSSRHGVSLTERKTNDMYICGDDKKNDELHQHKITTGKYLDNKAADLGGRKLPDSKNHDNVNSELPKSVLRPDNAAQYEFVNRNFHGEEALRAQMPQRQDPLIGCNAQMPGHYNGAACVTLNRHSGLHLPYPPIGMQGINYTSNGYGTGRPFGSGGAGGVHFLPEFQRSHQYIGPSTIIPPNPAPFNPAPFNPPSGPVHLPPGYGSLQPNHYAPLGFQRNFLPIQPQYPPFTERPPNQKNTGGWFDD